MIGIRQFSRILESNLNVAFNDLNCEIYVSKRRDYVHLCLDQNLWEYGERDNVIEYIKNYKPFRYDPSKTHKFMYPTRISATKWKFDYVIFKKIK